MEVQLNTDLERLARNRTREMARAMKQLPLPWVNRVQQLIEMDPSNFGDQMKYGGGEWFATDSVHAPVFIKKFNHANTEAAEQEFEL